MEERVLEKLQAAEMLLVGIGEEFEERSFLRAQPQYQQGSAYLEQIDRLDLLPLLADEILKTEGRAVTALQRLYQTIADKNYFVVSTCQTDILRYAGFPEERVVTPCGTLKKKQCVCGCEQSLAGVSASERAALCREIVGGSREPGALGVCEHCHGRMVLNNIYVEKYMESGYLEDWSRYTKWLQGTLNREICILELGVNLDYPSVIRFPFEKVAYYNRKASFIRINERLYQMTSELGEKGIAIAKNSIDWLCI
ncbi:MAG: hypothetical protein K2H45_03275 [Acetatifactor sp.]|nr:hypothetical protein [Acetatifactor sp.]